MIIERSQKDKDLVYLDIAKSVANLSKDPSTKVGCIIVDKEGGIHPGYNGFPQWIEDRSEWLEDRETKLMLTIHAEVNAIKKAGKLAEGGCLYLSTLIPCQNCAIQIVHAKLSRVVAWGQVLPRRWVEDMTKAKWILEQGKINLDIIGD